MSPDLTSLTFLTNLTGSRCDSGEPVRRKRNAVTQHVRLHFFVTSTSPSIRTNVRHSKGGTKWTVRCILECVFFYFLWAYYSKFYTFVCKLPFIEGIFHCCSTAPHTHRQRHARWWCRTSPGERWLPLQLGCLPPQWSSPRGVHCQCELRPDEQKKKQPNENTDWTTSLFFSFSFNFFYYPMTSNLTKLTLRAAKTSGLSSDPIENVWMGYNSFSSLASFTSVAATKLESRPPETKTISFINNTWQTNYQLNSDLSDDRRVEFYSWLTSRKIPQFHVGTHLQFLFYEAYILWRFSGIQVNCLFVDPWKQVQ